MTDVKHKVIKSLDDIPDDLKALAEEFPVGTAIETTADGLRHYLLGYTSDGLLIFSPICPTNNETWKQAQKEHVLIDPRKIREYCTRKMVN